MKYALQDPAKGVSLGYTMICDKESKTAPISHAIHIQKAHRPDNASN